MWYCISQFDLFIITGAGICNIYIYIYVWIWQLDDAFHLNFYEPTPEEVGWMVM